MADAAGAAPGTILQGGRAKAYRPLPETERLAAYERGLAAYEQGDFFEAHEILEPAWMGTADIGERELYQGLIRSPPGSSTPSAATRRDQPQPEGARTCSSAPATPARRRARPRRPHRRHRRPDWPARRRRDRDRATRAEEEPAMTMPPGGLADDRRVRGVREARSGRRGRPDARRRPRARRVQDGPGERRRPRPDVGVRRPRGGAAEGPPDLPDLRQRQPVGGGGRVPARSGWTDVANVAGGTTEWERRGLPVNRG